MTSQAATTTKAFPMLVGALIACLAGTVFLLTTDFGGWTEHTPYASDYTDYWVGLDADDIPRYAYALIVVAAASFLYPASCAAAALLRPSSAARRWLTGAYRGASLTAAGILVGGMLFLNQVSDEYDSWLDTGFYGSLSSAILAAVLLCWAARLAREPERAPAGKSIGSTDAAPARSAVAVDEVTKAPLPPVVTVDQTATHLEPRGLRRALPVLVAGASLLGVSGLLVALVSYRDSVSGVGKTTSASSVAVEGYVILEDDTQTISVAVPADWTDVNREPVDEGGETIPSIYAAPDLAAYDSSWRTPGLNLRALPVPAVGNADLGQIVAERARGWDTGTCTKRYPEPATPGFATIVLVNCGVAGGDGPSDFHLFAMRDDGERYVRYLELNLPEVVEPGNASDILATVPLSTKTHE